MHEEVDWMILVVAKSISHCQSTPNRFQTHANCDSLLMNMIHWPSLWLAADVTMKETVEGDTTASSPNPTEGDAARWCTSVPAFSFHQRGEMCCSVSLCSSSSIQLSLLWCRIVCCCHHFTPPHCCHQNWTTSSWLKWELWMKTVEVEEFWCDSRCFCQTGADPHCHNQRSDRTSTLRLILAWWSFLRQVASLSLSWESSGMQCCCSGSRKFSSPSRSFPWCAHPSLALLPRPFVIVSNPWMSFIAVGVHTILCVGSLCWIWLHNTATAAVLATCLLSLAISGSKKEHEKCIVALWWKILLLLLGLHTMQTILILVDQTTHSAQKPQKSSVSKLRRRLPSLHHSFCPTGWT